MRSHYDPQADFAALRTFAWLPRDQAAPGDQMTPNENFDSRIVADVERDLIAKGFRRAGVAEARIIPTMSFERTIARIDDAVAAMLKRFPPH